MKSVALLGLGARGLHTYAPYAKMHPDKMKIVAVADVSAEKVKIAAEEYGIPCEMCFSSAEELLAQPKLADAVFITTQDRQHVEQSLKK